MILIGSSCLDVDAIISTFSLLLNMNVIVTNCGGVCIHWDGKPSFYIIQHVQSAVKRPVSHYMKYTICLWPLFTIIDARSENLQYLQGKQSKAMMTSLVGESY